MHQLTAIGPMNTRNLDAAFVATNRLRTEGTDHLIAAARAAGARRFVGQSFAPWSYKREGGPAKAEDDPLETDPPKHVEETLAAIRHLEAAVTGADGLEGIVLRYGGFYGPGTGLARGGDMLEMVAQGPLPDRRRRRRRVVARAHRGRRGGDRARRSSAARRAIYNIADDEPAPVREWLPALAEAVGGRRPRHMPGFLGRLLLGPAGYAMMTEHPRRLQREGQARAGLGARVPELAPGVRRAVAGDALQRKGDGRVERRAQAWLPRASAGTAWAVGP